MLYGLVTEPYMTAFMNELIDSHYIYQKKCYALKAFTFEKVLCHITDMCAYYFISHCSNQ